MGVFDMQNGDIVNQPLGGKKKVPPASGIAAPVVSAPAALPSPDQPAAQVAAPGIAAGADGFMRAHQTGDATSISYPPVVPNMTTLPAPIPTMAVPPGIEKNMAVNPNSRVVTETLAGMRQPNNQVQVMRGQAPKSPEEATASAVPTAKTVDDGYGGVYTPGSSAIGPDKAGSGIVSGIANFFKDSAQAARTGVHYDDVKANRLASEAPQGNGQPQPANLTIANPAGFQQNPFGAKPDAMGVAPSTDGQMMTGRSQYDATGLNKTGMALPDSSSGGFTAKDGTSYNVNPSKQEGIAKITATGKNPLYTNIKPEDAVSGLNNQMIGGDAASIQEGLDRHARANAITQSIIDKQPMGGIAVLADPNEAANAEKTARWRQDDLLAQAKGGNRAAGEVAQEVARGQSHIASEAIRGGTQQAAEQGRNAVTMRGQDISAQSEANRLAGNPMDNQIKQNQITAGQMTNAIAKQLQDLHTAYGAETDPVKQRAIAEQIRVLSGKGGADRYIPVQGGEEIGPDGITKIHRPGSIFDTGSRQFISSEQGKTGATGADKIKADMQAGKISRDEAIKQLKAMGYQ